MRIMRLVAAIGVSATLAAAPAFAARPSALSAAPMLHDAAGLHVTSVRQVNTRLLAVTATTKALPRPVNIYVLLPPAYASNPPRRYPVLYLLHGTNGTASDWTLKGAAQQVIGDRNLITVMPDIALDDGGGGFCTDWPSGAQRWETFHIGQLLPWVDANLRTIPLRGQRAIAGLSQGGFCSLSYAARHPDLFATALAYSGAPDIYYDARDRAGAAALVAVIEAAWSGQSPNTFFGDQATNGINWAAHDPATLAENLRGTRLSLFWGNGQPGPYDDPSTYDAGSLEGLLRFDNEDFQTRLNALHIPAYINAYGPGTHSWPYWERDLKQSVDSVMSAFAHPAPDPSSFSYTSADNAYAVYGWQVTTHRSAREFSTLTTAGSRSFTLSGSGSATVMTPPTFAPHHTYTVRLEGAAAGTRTVRVVADAQGRLHLEVVLGPSNAFQQETAPAVAAGTQVFSSEVTIS